eukprot:SAG22_NODE_2400_length_2616_cov_4.016289_1_plen_136_part_00
MAPSGSSSAALLLLSLPLLLPLLLGHVAGSAPPSPKRWVSMWYTPANITVNTRTLALLAKEGGPKLVTSLQLYCEDLIREDGSFEAGASPGCDMLIPKLAAMGIGAERIVGAKTIGALRVRRGRRGFPPPHPPPQ